MVLVVREGGKLSRGPRGLPRNRRAGGACGSCGGGGSGVETETSRGDTPSLFLREDGKKKKERSSRLVGGWWGLWRALARGDPGDPSLDRPNLPFWKVLFSAIFHFRKL